MNGEQPKQPGEGIVYERCLCRQAVDTFLQATGLGSQEAKQHFRNSRVEFLKGIRSILDARIDALSRPQQEGTKVTIE